MTPYRDRREAGHYDPPSTKHQPIATTTTADLTGLTGDLTLKELQEQAAELDLPTYGTKAELRERIEAASQEP